jgi:hypothetical protein
MSTDDQTLIINPPGSENQGDAIPDVTPPASSPASQPDIARFLELLAEVTQLALQAHHKPPDGEWWLVLVPPVGRATARSYPSIGEVVDVLRGYHGQEVQGFVFNGIRVRTAAGGNYLLAPQGPISLFNPPGSPEAEDDDGFMGQEPVPAPSPSSAGGSEELEDEEDEEDD